MKQGAIELSAGQDEIKHVLLALLPQVACLSVKELKEHWKVKHLLAYFLEHKAAPFHSIADTQDY